MSNGSGLLLLDTNVLVYAHDRRDWRKQAIAVDLLDRCITAERAALCAQSLSEFYVVVTRRLLDRLRPQTAMQQIERLAAACRVLDMTTPLLLEGCRGSEAHGISFWDALVWAAAKLAQIPCVLTEDAHHGRSIEGVTFLDPFRREFNAEALALRG